MNDLEGLAGRTNVLLLPREQKLTHRFLQAASSLLRLPTSRPFKDRKMQTRLGRLFARLFYVSLLSASAAAGRFPGSDLPESSFRSH